MFGAFLINQSFMDDGIYHFIRWRHLLPFSNFLALPKLAFVVGEHKKAIHDIYLKYRYEDCSYFDLCAEGWLYNLKYLMYVLSPISIFLNTVKQFSILM